MSINSDMVFVTLWAMKLQSFRDLALEETRISSGGTGSMAHLPYSFVLRTSTL
jgi:hypothetical protein